MKCKCGHTKIHHIYEEGACRSGTICSSKCEKFEQFISERESAIQSIIFALEHAAIANNTDSDGHEIIQTLAKEALETWRKVNE